MGKGDKRTRRGKIFAGSFGKTRPKYKAEVFTASEKATTARAEKAAPKKRAPKRVAAAAAPVEEVASTAETPVEETAAVEETRAEDTPSEPSEQSASGDGA